VDGVSSVQLTQPKNQNQLKKGNMDEEKKDQPDVRDLEPNKDAKGGGTGGTQIPRPSQKTQ
jgi:hypothetical protein